MVHACFETFGQATSRAMAPRRQCDDALVPGPATQLLRRQ